VFRVSQSDVEKLVYPTLLLFTGILLVLGLGVFQRLSASVEQEVEDKSERQAAARAKKS
jgi:hypothetical protein